MAAAALQLHRPGQLARGRHHGAHPFHCVTHGLADLVHLARAPGRQRRLVAEDHPQIVQLAGRHRNLHLDGQRGHKFHVHPFPAQGNGRAVTTHHRHRLHGGLQVRNADQRQGMRGTVLEQIVHDRCFQRRQRLQRSGDGLRREQSFQLRKHRDSFVLDVF